MTIKEFCVGAIEGFKFLWGLIAAMSFFEILLLVFAVIVFLSFIFALQDGDATATYIAYHNYRRNKD
jgi:hypothetical protein